jgi:adenylate cyclase, class 2
MKPAHEIEIKLPVSDAPALRRYLTVLGFRQACPRHFESNVLYDFADGWLRRARCLLRVRRARGRWLLTFKGPAVRSRPFKVRREIETEVRDGKALRRLLAGVGLRPAFRYEKYRTVYHHAKLKGANALHRLEVMLDETPIGCYLELEGDQRAIDQVAEQLGFRRRDYLTASYAGLYLRWARNRGQKPGDMVFGKRGVRRTRAK